MDDRFARRGTTTSSFGRSRDQMSKSYGSRGNSSQSHSNSHRDIYCTSSRNGAYAEGRTLTAWEVEVQETEADPMLKKMARIIGEIKKSPPPKHRAKCHDKIDNSNKDVKLMQYINDEYYTTGLKTLLTNTLWRGPRSTTTVRQSHGNVNELKKQASAMNARLHSANVKLNSKRVAHEDATVEEQQVAKLQREYDEHMKRLTECIGTKKVVSHAKEYNAAKFTVKTFNTASSHRASRKDQLIGAALSNLIKESLGKSHRPTRSATTLEDYYFYASTHKASPAPAPTPAPPATKAVTLTKKESVVTDNKDEGWHTTRSSRNLQTFSTESNQPEREIVYVPNGSYIPPFKRAWTKYESERPVVQSVLSNKKSQPRAPTHVKPQPRIPIPAQVVVQRSQLTGWAALAAKVPEKPRSHVTVSATTAAQKSKCTATTFQKSRAFHWDDSDSDEEDSDWEEPFTDNRCYEETSAW